MYERNAVAIVIAARPVWKALKENFALFILGQNSAWFIAFIRRKAEFTLELITSLKVRHSGGIGKGN